MKKFVCRCCLCFLLAVVAIGAVACTKNPNELILTDAVIYYGEFQGERFRYTDFIYRTTTKKDYEVIAAALYDDGTEKWVFPADKVGWSEAQKNNGVKEVSIRVYLSTSKDTDEGVIRITIKDGEKIIKEQTFNYECKEREKE